MIEVYVPDGGQMRRSRVAADALPDACIWIDLKDPTREEELAVEALCGIEVPTREEMREIEATSRLYSEDGADFMTASVAYGIDSGQPHFAPVTFVLVGERLITLRYSDPKSFAIFSDKLCRAPGSANRAKRQAAAMPAADGDADPLGVSTSATPAPLAPKAKNGRETPAPTADSIAIGLLETVIDRIADLLESISTDLDGIGDAIFATSSQHKPIGTREFKELLRRIGAAGDLTSRVRESLATLDRLLPYLQFAIDRRKPAKETRQRVKAMTRDIQSLGDFDTFLSNKTTFLLDTTVGLISIEQNAIIKIFSVASVAFLPPTLVASIYGMNFQFMPELGWHFGYPMAIIAMILSAVGPLFYFRHRNWL